MGLGLGQWFWFNVVGLLVCGFVMVCGGYLYGCVCCCLIGWLRCCWVVGYCYLLVVGALLL